MPAEAPPTLFDWQIRQEEHRFGGLSDDVLNSQDEDGDTYVWYEDKRDLMPVRWSNCALNLPRILHIAVAKGRRAVAHVLAGKMARCGSLELKDRHGQVAFRNRLPRVASRFGLVSAELFKRLPADGASDRGRRRSAPDHPGPIGAWGPVGHAGPVGPVPPAPVC